MTSFIVIGLVLIIYGACGFIGINERIRISMKMSHREAQTLRDHREIETFNEYQERLMAIADAEWAERTAIRHEWTTTFISRGVPMLFGIVLIFMAK